MANVITVSRIIFSIALIFFDTFSPGFYVFYIASGVSDISDGLLARMTHTESNAGALLDSIADMVFVAVCLFIFWPAVRMEPWLLIPAGIIASVRIINAVCGFIKYKRAVFLHTALNKLTGVMLFVLPLTLQFIAFRYSASVVCAAAAFASLQESFLIFTGKADIK